MMRSINILGKLWLFGLAAWTLCLVLCMGDAGTVWTISYLMVIWDLIAALGLFIMVRVLNMESLYPD